MAEKLEQVGGAVQSQVIYGCVDTDEVRRVQSDLITRALIDISQAHHEVHEGRSFEATYELDVPNASTHGVLLTTPNTTRYSHLEWIIDVEGEADIILYEIPLINSGTGASITIYNKNRNSALTSGCTTFGYPALLTVGSVKLEQIHIGSGKQIGGGSRGIEEWILKPNYKYILLATNSTASNNFMSIKMAWYEHVNLA